MRSDDRLEWCLRMQRRILRNVEVHPSGCWLWTGRLNNDGYAVMSMRMPGCKSPRPMFGHRVAWEAFRKRRMPKRRVGAHSVRCVSRACCNWEHVRATTQSHNERDKARAKALKARKASPMPRRWTKGNISSPVHTIFPKPVKPIRVVVDGITVPF